MSMYVSDMLENRKGKGENAHNQLQGSILSLSYTLFKSLHFPWLQMIRVVWYAAKITKQVFLCVAQRCGW